MTGMAQAIGPLLKTTLFTIFVPGVVAGYIPWQLRQNATTAISGPAEWAAIALILAGIAIYLFTAFWGFALIGGGTPAPIAPTRKLVVVGLHRFVRNPMYIGVALIIGGQAWLFHSRPIAIYLALFALIAHAFVLAYEEPTLRKQFGQEYEDYVSRVPRWIPRWPR